MNKVTVTKLPKSRVEVVVEVGAEDFKVFVEKALAEVVKEAEIPGFRKGMAPKEMVKSKIGNARILDRAGMMAIEGSYPEAVRENKLEPLGYPEVSIQKIAEGSPFEYKAAVTVYPEIVLPDYKQIAGGIKFKEAEVLKEDIERLKMEKQRHINEHLREDALAAIAEKTKVEVPDLLVVQETEKMMQQLKEKTPRALNMSFDEYLKKINKTEKELYESMNKDNEAKIKNFLVLQEIARKEKVEVNDKEAEEAAKKAGTAEGENMDEAKAYYREMLKTEKTFELLEEMFKK